MKQSLSDDVCLAIVDVQCGFVNEYTAHIPKLVESLQREYRHVLASRFVNEPDSSFRQLMNWQRFAEPSSDRALAFDAMPGTYVFEKSTYTIWTPEVRQFLESHNVREVHLVGIDTDVCVLVSAVDLFQNGIRPVVRAEYCASHGGPNYDRAALLILERLIGKKQINLGLRASAQ